MAEESFREALHAYLSGHVLLTPLIGTRIFPSLAPATATRPYLTYERIAYYRTKHVLGLSAMIEESYQFDAWDSTPLGAENVMRTLRDVLDGFRGLLQSVQVSFTDVTSIFDDLEEPTQGKTVGIERRVVDITFWYIP